MILEIASQGLFEDVVVAVVFTFRPEYSLPHVAMFQIAVRNEFRNAIRDGDGLSDLHDERDQFGRRQKRMGEQPISRNRNFLKLLRDLPTRSFLQYGDQVART